MGSSISHIYDRYETYKEFCDLVKEKPVDIRDNFFQHQDILLKKHGYIENGN